MRYPLTLITLTLAASASAQNAPTSAQAIPATPLTATPAVSSTVSATTLQNVVVTGTTDLLANLVKATLSTQEGTPLSSINLRAVEQEVMATGYFKTATASLSIVGGQHTLGIAVTSNPVIKEVQATGMSFLPAEEFKQRLADLMNIAPGAALNTQRLEEAKQALIQNYRQLGFPFAPAVSTTVKTNADGSANVTFVVDETAPITRVEVSGVTALPASTVTNIFKPLQDSKKFTTPAFFAAANALQEAYADAGYIQTGLDPAGVTLENGVLRVQVIEGKVSAIDTSQLGNISLPATLQIKVGQPLKLEELRQDVRTLANQTGKPVGFNLQADPADPSRVVVAFGSAEVESGPVKSIVFQGNTLVPTSSLQAALKTKVGDVYSPQLAQDDFVALRETYRKAGYEISTRDAISFKDGVLAFQIREVRLVGYKLAWQGTHKTRDEVILRELPAVGSAFNLKAIRDSLGNISRLGIVNITGENVESNDAQNPENITYVVQLAEQRNGIPINLGLGYETINGWSGEVRYENNNLFGRNHIFSIGAQAATNQAGQNWSGSASYTIPWLDFNFGDFKRKRTSATVSVYSSVDGNSPVVDADRNDTGRDYTQRTTGFGVTLGRNLTPNLGLSVGASVNRRTYYLEPMQSGEVSSVGDNQATALLPKDSLTTQLQTGINYDNTDDFNFPGEGTRAAASVGYSFGQSGGTPLGWSDLQVGARKYFGFGARRTQALGNETYTNVVAVRANYGAYMGNYLKGTGFYVGGSSANPATELRGINDGQLFGTSYLTSSVEFRHDFGLNASIAQGLYGVLWGDYGGVWNAGKFNSAYGVGAGLQLNLGLGGAQLPTLRFDYGWSPQRVDSAGKKESGGKFMFRIGNFW